MKHLILLLCLLSSYCHASDENHWSTQDKTQFATYTALSVIDYSQTSWAMKQKDSEGNYLYEEKNPLLGNRPSDEKIAIAQLLGIGVMYYDIEHYGDKHRKLRWVIIAIKTAVVIHNNSVGLTVSKVW